MTINSKMVLRILFVCMLILVIGCESDSQKPISDRADELRIPKWSFLGKVSANFVDAQATVPRKAYVFPVVRLDSAGNPIDQMSYRLDEADQLSWHTDVPSGGEIKVIIENKLRERGFTIVEFSEVAGAKQGRTVLVFNPYFREPTPAAENPEADLSGSWSTYARITAATFGTDLTPESRIELMNQELLSLYNGKEKSGNVKKRTFEYLLDYIGVNRQWSELIYML